jgi:capsular exopolysaccharide synthesis family protein
VTNSIADLFIDRLLEYKRYQTRSILETLEEQMSVAQKELSQSEEALRNFRSRNPRVFLSDARQSMIQNMAENEALVNTYQNNLSDIKQLQQNLASSPSKESKHYAYQNLIAFMESQQVPGATLFSSRYQELLTELRQLQTEGYSDTHPSISATQDQIMRLQTEIDGRFRQFQAQISSNIERTNQNLNSERQNLRKLPGSELRLAELIRNRSIKENVLTNIMVRYNEAKVTDAAVIPDAYIIDYAQPPIIRPKGLTWNLLIFAGGGILGVLLALAAFLGLAYIDKRLWTSKEVEDKLGFQVLALIPKIGDEKTDYFKNNETIDPKLVTSDYAPTASGEAFRRLRTLLNLRLERQNKTIVISSHFPNEGKSLICSNLAIAYAQQKMKTLLIDGDLRRGVQHSSFAREKVPGLSDMLVKRTDVNQQSISQFIKNTHVPNLFLLTSGQQIPNPSEILSSKHMQRIYEILITKFDRIVIDTPPFGVSPEVFVLNGYVHNLAFVLMSNKTNISKFSEAIKEFNQLRNDICGVIINGADEDPNRKYYDYSYYNY